MLARLRTAKEDGESGFTLIELLVVMIIIGILAAIAVPVFLSQRAKARDTATKADVSTIGKEIASYYVDGTEAFEVTVADGQAVLTAGTPPVEFADITLSEGTEFTDQDGASGTDFCVALTNEADDSTTWQYSAEGGLAAGPCNAP